MHGWAASKKGRRPTDGGQRHNHRSTKRRCAVNDMEFFKQSVRRAVESNTPLDWSFTSDPRYKTVLAEIARERKQQNEPQIASEPTSKLEAVAAEPETEPIATE